jgi:hypothetical protein
MTLVKRVALIMLIGTSLITAGASIAKATKMVVSDNVGEASYESTLAAIFSNTEQNLVIIIGSLPALRNVSRSNDGPFSRVKSFFSSYVDSRKGTSSSSDGLRKDTETSDSGSGSDTNLQRNSRNHRPQGSSSNFRRPIDAPYKSGDSAQHPMEKHVDIAIP